MASLKELKIKQAKEKYKVAKLKGDRAGMVRAHADADRARGSYTKTVNVNGQYQQQAIGNMGEKASSGELISQTRKLNQTQQIPAESTRQIPLATRVRTGTVDKTPTSVPKKNILQDAFDKEENYIDKAKKGNIGGAAANFVGTGLTGLQTLYLNAANAVDSVTRGRGLPKYRQMMDFTDYDKAVAERRGAKPTIEKVSKINPVLGGIYQMAGEIGTDPLELLPGGMVNDIKLARGTAQGSAAYADALKAGKMSQAGQNIVKASRATEKIPIVGPDGKIKYQTVPKNTPAQTNIQAQSAPDIPTVKPQPETPIRSAQITPEPRKGNLGAVASQRQARVENGGFNPTTQNVQPDPGVQNINTPVQNPQPRFKDLGADVQSVAPQKVSKVRSNTYENSRIFTDAEKEVMDSKDYMYDVVSEKQSLAEAKQRLEVDFDGEALDLPNKLNFDGVDLDTSMGIMEKYLADARASGDYSKVDSWAKTIQEKGTQNGQMIQAFAKYSRTPEGALIKAKQTIAKVERDIQKANPNLINKVDQETKQVTNAIKKAQEETVDELIQRYTAGSVESLTNKISGTVTNGKNRNIAPLQQAFNDLTNELFAIAKDSLPRSKKLAKRELVATDILKSAIDNKKNYQEVWEKAKATLYEKYADDENVMMALEQYFDRNAIPNFSTKTLDSAVKQTSKDFGADLGKIIKSNQNDKTKLAKDIQDYVLYKVGAQGDDAKALANEILQQYNTILRAKTESALKQMFPEAYGKQLPIAKRASMSQRVMELINMGAYDNEAIRNVIKAKNKLPVLDNSEIKAIVENMELSAKQTDPYMKNMYARKAEQIMSDKIPATFREKFRAMQRLSLILNPKTLITRNPLGNTLLGTAENIKDVPASLIDIAVSKRTGQRTTTLSAEKMKAQVQGFGQGLKEWGADIKYGVDTSPSRGQFELPSGRVFKNPVLNMFDQFERKALQIGDRPFYQAAYNGRMAELKKLGKVGEEAELDARLFALDRVFQNDSELSKRAVQIRKTLGLPGDLLMPFTQTPANILDKLIDYSPAGLAKAIAHLGATAGKGTFDQKKFVDTLARTFTGGGIAMLTYAMMEKGILTGSLSDNADVRQAEQLQGKQYYSVKIDGKWYSYDWAQPIAGIMAATADAIKAGATKDDFTEALVEGGTTAIDSVFNQSFLSGILTAFSGYSPASGIGAALLGSTSQVTPTAGANLARTIDPVVRETYDPNTFKEQANKLIARIPLASKMLPAKVDVKGEEIMQNQGRGLGARAFENFLAPYRLSEETNDPINAELMRLQSRTGENAVLLNKTPKGFEKDGNKYVFGAEEYIAYQRTAGQTAYGDIDKLVSSPEYQNMTDEEKADSVKDIQSEAIERARMEFFKNKGMSQLMALSDSQREKYSEISALGVKEDQYIDTYYAAKGIESLKDDAGKTIRLSESYLKKKAIDKANPGASPAELMALYHAFDVSKSVWEFN